MLGKDYEVVRKMLISGCRPSCYNSVDGRSQLSGSSRNEDVVLMGPRSTRQVEIPHSKMICLRQTVFRGALSQISGRDQKFVELVF